MNFPDYKGLCVGLIDANWEKQPYRREEAGVSQMKDKGHFQNRTILSKIDANLELSVDGRM